MGSPSNTEVSLYRNGQNVHAADYTELLSCYNMRWLWARWQNGVIEFGKGQNFDETILSWTDTEPLSILAVSLSNNEPDPAEWQLSEDQGRRTIFCPYS